MAKREKKVVEFEWSLSKAWMRSVFGGMVVKRIDIFDMNQFGENTSVLRCLIYVISVLRCILMHHCAKLSAWIYILRNFSLFYNYE